MTIRPGDEWGSLAEAPRETVWFSDEASLGAFLEREGCVRPVGLTGGDLHRAAGRPTKTIRASIDLLEVRFGRRQNNLEELRLCISFVTIGSCWKNEPMTLLSNSGSVAGDEWFPRSHPNDGHCEVAEFAREMGVRARWMARQRARRGEPTTHPLITTSAFSVWEWSGPSRRLVIDRREMGRVSVVHAMIKPDALTVFLGNPSTSD